MSQKNPSDGCQKGFAVGRGLLAAAETLNFSMNEQRSGPASRPMGGMVSAMGGGGDDQDHSTPLSRRGGNGGGGGVGNNIGSTMKLFASLGLSPADLDALAQIPEENISVETLPHILMQLKSRKNDPGDRRMAGNPRDLPPMSSDSSYRGPRDDWEDMPTGKMGPSMGQSSARAPASNDFGYGSMQDLPSNRDYSLDFGNSSGGTGGRDRQYSELSRHDSYGGMGMGSMGSNPVFMQRRIGSPSHGKIQDFLGVMPPMFPHVCSLCDFDVHSTMEWNQHTNGLRHSENRRLLLQMYPDWAPGMSSSRSSGSLFETPNLSAGLLGPAPMSTGYPSGNMPSSWGGGSGGGPSFANKNQLHPGQPMRSRVVVARYYKKPLSNKSMFALAEPFGKIRKHLFVKTKAFLEMDSHQEAQDMVNYYQRNPAVLQGRPITFYLSKELMAIEDHRGGDRGNRDGSGQNSQVVFFSNLPREEEKKTELLTIARRFGVVEKHLFLTDEAFIQLGTPEDAEMLVKYYTLNPLTVKGRLIRLNICTKYKTLNVNRRVGQDSANHGEDSRNRKRSSTNRSSRTSTSKSSSSTSKSKEDRKKMDPADPEEEVAGVMEGHEEENEEDEEEDENENEHATDSDTEKSVAEPPPETEGPESTKVAPDAVTATTGDGDRNPDGANVGDISEPKPDEIATKAVVTVEKESEPAEGSGPTEESEAHDEPPMEENPEMMEGDISEDLEMDQDLENMEDFVTLDELAEEEEDPQSNKDQSIDNTRAGGMRVVSIGGFKRGYGFRNELLALAEPFGKVVKHLVLDLRPEAYIQFETEEQARAMDRFYSGNVTALVCGRPVRVTHSMSYPTIQSGGSRVVYVGQLPNGKYSDQDILKLAEPFGQVKKYFVNRIKRECFIEMESAEEAEKMVDACKLNPLKLQGRRLMVYVCRKYKQLKYGHRRPSTLEEKKPFKRENSGGPKSTKHEEEPPSKKLREEKPPAKEEESADPPSEEQEKAADPETDAAAEGPAPPAESSEPKSTTDAVKQEQGEVEVSPSLEPSASAVETEPVPPPPPAEAKPAPASLPLAAYDPSTPIGVEYVKMGYYCRVCFLFYSNEETAKKVHCSSQAHYDKLKKYLEKEKTQGSKKVKPTVV